MSDEGAGPGAGSTPQQTPAPFQVSWKKLKAAVDTEVLDMLRDYCPTAKYYYRKRDGKKAGVEVSGKPYSWVDIAAQWNNNTLHGKWGVDQGILKELLEDGS